MDKDEKQAIQDYVNMMLANTLRLVDIEPPPEDAPEGALRTASGILVFKQGNDSRDTAVPSTVANANRSAQKWQQAARGIFGPGRLLSQAARLVGRVFAERVENWCVRLCPTKDSAPDDLGSTPQRHRRGS